MSAERGRDVVSWKLVFPPPLNACGETVSLDYRRGAAPPTIYAARERRGPIFGKHSGEMAVSSLVTRWAEQDRLFDEGNKELAHITARNGQFVGTHNQS